MVGFDPNRPLGTIDFVELTAQQPHEGRLQYGFEASRAGVLTAELTAGGVGPSTEMTLYRPDADGQLQQLATGRTRFDYDTAVAGQEYVVHVTGLESQVDLRFANLVSRAGSDVTVHGTDGNDAFEAFVETTQFVINGLVYSASQITPVETIHFLGDGGADTATLTGSDGDDHAELSPNSADVTTPELRFLVEATEQVHVDGAGGSNTALLYDSDGHDAFFGGPTSPQGTVLSGTTLAGQDFTNEVVGFGSVYAYSRNGGTDAADLYDSDATKDDFIGKPGDGTLYGPGFYYRAFDFEQVNAHASAADGFDDTAKLYDSDGDDTLQAGPTSPEGTKLAGTTVAGWSYANAVEGFRYVLGYAQNGGADTAHLYDSATSRDWFVGKLAYTKLYGSEFYSQAIGFGEVHGHASSDGFNDSAWLFDSDGDDTFYAGPASPVATELSGTTLGGQSYVFAVDGFRNVYGYAQNGGSDTAELYDSEASLDYFVGTPDADVPIAWEDIHARIELTMTRILELADCAGANRASDSSVVVSAQGITCRECIVGIIVITLNSRANGVTAYAGQARVTAAVEHRRVESTEPLRPTFFASALLEHLALVEQAAGRCLSINPRVAKDGAEHQASCPGRAAGSIRDMHGYASKW